MEAKEMKSQRSSGDFGLSHWELICCFEAPLDISYMLAQAMQDQRKRCLDFRAQIFIFCLQEIPAWADFHNKEEKLS